MAAQPAGLGHGGEALDTKAGHEHAKGKVHTVQEAAAPVPLFLPQCLEEHGSSGEHMARENVERHRQRVPGVFWLL